MIKLYDSVAPIIYRVENIRSVYYGPSKTAVHNYIINQRHIFSIRTDVL